LLRGAAGLPAVRSGVAVLDVSTFLGLLRQGQPFTAETRKPDQGRYAGVEGGEHEDGQLLRWPGEADAAGGLDTVDTRHADVHEHDVGLRVVQLPERGDAVGGLGDDSWPEWAPMMVRRPVRIMSWWSTSITRITAAPPR
jgi:hypothetical protein